MIKAIFKKKLLILSVIFLVLNHHKMVSIEKYNKPNRSHQSHALTYAAIAAVSATLPGYFWWNSIKKNEANQNQINSLKKSKQDLENQIKENPKIKTQIIKQPSANNDISVNEEIIKLNQKIIELTEENKNLKKNPSIEPKNDSNIEVIFTQSKQEAPSQDKPGIPPIDPWNITTRICQLIDSAKKKILLTSYSFTNDKIYDALERAYNRGVLIECIFDYEAGLTSQTRGSKVLDLAALSQPTKHLNVHIFPPEKKSVSTGSLKMHNKFIDVDNMIITTGSFNYTNNANYNKENIVIITDKRIAKIYANTFYDIQKKSAKLMPNGDLVLLDGTIKHPPY